MKKFFTSVIIFIILGSCSNLDQDVSENTLIDNTIKKKVDTPAKVIQESNYPTNNTSTIWDTVDIKVESFINNKEAIRDLEKIPPSFQRFYTQFVNDSIYQKEHIDFDRLIGVISECEQTLRLDKKNWEFSDWNFTLDFDKDNNVDPIDGWNNVFYFDDKTFFFQFEIKEVGIICQEGYEKIDGKWTMVLSILNNC